MSGTNADGSSCTLDTCTYTGDGECDEGMYCAVGSDCSDCGGDCCERSGCGIDRCRYSGDGECDDGSRGGAQYCALATDCRDCGNCCASEETCGTNSCRWAGDSECDDGSTGHAQYCELGTDCDDCGNCCGGSGGSAGSGGGDCDSDGCHWAGDGECDDGSRGGTQYCSVGTDCSDCGNCCGGGGGGDSSCPPNSSPSSSGGCACDSGFSVNADRSGCVVSSCGADTCRYAADNECDEGLYCSAGSDCSDCGTCCEASSSCNLSEFVQLCSDAGPAPDCGGPCVHAIPSCIGEPALAPTRATMQGILDACTGHR